MRIVPSLFFLCGSRMAHCRSPRRNQERTLATQHGRLLRGLHVWLLAKHLRYVATRPAGAPSQ